MPPSGSSSTTILFFFLFLRVIWIRNGSILTLTGQSWYYKRRLTDGSGTLMDFSIVSWFSGDYLLPTFAGVMSTNQIKHQFEKKKKNHLVQLARETNLNFSIYTLFYQPVANVSHIWGKMALQEQETH